MAACGPDIVSVDGSVDLNDAIKRVGPGFAFQVGVMYGQLQKTFSRPT